MTSYFRQFYFSFFMIVIFSLTSCAAIKAEQEKRWLETRKKIKIYRALYQEILNGTIKVGTSPEEIRQKFGEPNDNFQSVSSTSKFETWSYEKVTSQEDKAELAPIRLYFNDNKLVSWSY